MLIRPVQAGDVTDVVSMVHDLAAYERAADLCELAGEQLAAALFGPAPALFGHVAAGDDGRLVGFALWFVNFSTWQGRHGIYLEDLYVRPEARGAGAGGALLAELGRLCVQRGYGRLQWWVLDCNDAASRFYGRAGAEPQQEWTVWRLSGDALTELAGTAPQSPGSTT